MEYSRSRVNLVILDACRNNPVQRRFRSMARGLAQMGAPSGSLIAYATAPGEVAEDGPGANSPYTAALAEAIIIPGLAVEQAYKRVRITVKKATGDRQVPWDASSLTGEFSFTPATSVAQPTPPPVTGPATPAVGIYRPPSNQESQPERLPEEEERVEKSITSDLRSLRTSITVARPA